jgi:hypothetical protein
MLSESEAAVRWIGQVEIDDQPPILDMLDRFVLVTRDEFDQRLTACIEAFAAAHTERHPIALYAEREIPKSYGHPNRLFKQRARPPRSAWGAGPQPVRPTQASMPSVGSEGLVANIVTQLQRKHAHFLSHPGPNAIRSKEVRTFLIVTDFIGTVSRVRSYLESMWRAASVRSWWSGGMIRIAVVAYAGTASGVRFVEAHPSRPIVEIVVPCPTVDDFPMRQRERCAAVCKKYDPTRKSRRFVYLGFGDEREYLGWGGIGALVAFAHGCPNDVPLIFHKSGGRRNWQPLFPGRTTDDTYAHFGNQRDERTTTQRLHSLGMAVDRAGALVQNVAPSARGMLLFLVALRAGFRREEAIARQTGLTLAEVRSLRRDAVRNDWLTERGHITDAGRSEVANVPRVGRDTEPLLEVGGFDYYPTSLRAPLKV